MSLRQPRLYPTLLRLPSSFDCHTAVFADDWWCFAVPFLQEQFGFHLCSEAEAATVPSTVEAVTNTNGVYESQGGTNHTIDYSDVRVSLFSEKFFKFRIHEIIVHVWMMLSIIGLVFFRPI